MMKLPIAAQVYSVREQAAADFDAAMGELARMGYDGVELAGLYGKSPKEILEILDHRGLKAVSAHVPYDEFVKDLEGTVEDVIFYNEDSGFTVLAVSVEDELITLVGKTSGVAEGEEITAEGHYDVHPRFGHQFKADVILRTLPTASNAILKYLSSGAIKGIGPAIARRLGENK